MTEPQREVDCEARRKESALVSTNKCERIHTQAPPPLSRSPLPEGASVLAFHNRKGSLVKLLRSEVRRSRVKFALYASEVLPMAK